ncbi:MAG: CRTAC1 family protein, partial [Pyrinomonadaceae bacterium]|nr:CRTAC1 family protein [Pyrinomonadaceae bacterium]
DQVIVAPVPDTAERFQPFELTPGASLFRRETMAPMGCLPGDVNEDGLMDVIVYYWGRTPVAFIHKTETASQGAKLSAASYVAQEIVQGGERWYTNAATFADLDGDGHADLIAGNYFQDGAHILDANSPVPDEMQHSMSRASNGGGSHLLRWTGASQGNEPSVQFSLMQGAIEGDVEGKLSHGWTLAVGAEDLDGDLLPEIYFANDFGSDRLFHNRSRPGAFHFVLLEGEKGFQTPSSKVLGHDSFKGMGVDFGDLNADGLPDIFVSNIAREFALEESHLVFISTGQTGLMQEGVAPYIDRSEPLGLSRSGWSWDVKLGDFNNDTKLEVIQATGFVRGAVNRWPELHELAMGNDQLLEYPGAWPRLIPGEDGLSFQEHNPFFMLAGDGRYYDVAPELGLGVPQISRGISTADVDGDGRLDFTLANQWDDSYFYHNQSAAAGAFLGLHLRLPVTAQDAGQTKVCPGHPQANLASFPAIGAQATVYLPNNRRLVGQVDGGNGHSGKRSSDLHFGLGNTGEMKIRVALRWRDRAGVVRQTELELSPGWHTVLLGGAEGGSNECR